MRSYLFFPPCCLNEVSIPNIVFNLATMATTNVQIIVSQMTGKKTPFMLSLSSKIADLKQKIADFEGLPIDSFTLVFMGQNLTDKSDSLLSEFNLRNGSVVNCLVRARGGSTTFFTDQTNNFTFTAKALLQYKTTDDNCLDKYEDEDVPRIKMNCGHAVSAPTLMKYIKNKLSSHQIKIRCPYITNNGVYDKDRCTGFWDFFYIFKTVALTNEQITLIEEKLNSNYMFLTGVINCKVCNTYLIRIAGDNIRVICPICTKIKKTAYEFCYHCLTEWSGSTCVNPECQGKDPRIKIINNCGSKTIGTVQNVPKIRCCVTCGFPIEHSADCKHMTCGICNSEFCFVCLKPKINGQWQCGTLLIQYVL